MINPYNWQKSDCEYLRSLAKQKFFQVKDSWIECGKWALPHRTKWLLAQTPGARNNYHIVDPSHVIALRSYVAGFLEGNTSASRPWYRVMAQDPDQSETPEVHKWLDTYTQRTLACFGSSNFYYAAGLFYYDYGTFNTGAHYIDEIKGKLHFHNLVPGSYYVINNGLGEAVILIHEFSLSIKALVDTYGTRTASGGYDWSMFSDYVKRAYENGNYTFMVDVVQVVRENEHFNPEHPIAMLNKRWISLTYEVTAFRNQFGANDSLANIGITQDMPNNNKFLKTWATKRKPFIVGKSDSSGNYEYGESGPTLTALGCIKSLNKKAIGKDQALEQMLRPALQGPANLKKSYISTAPNSYIPLDANALKANGLRSVFDVNPQIANLVQDVGDLRAQVDKIYYADYLLYLSRNPKTRTATETNAIVQEQQLIIGPNLQSLNWTYNQPVVEFVMSFVLDNDPYLPPPPKALQGQFLRTEFVSVFAQAQKAADLPAIERYIQSITGLGQVQPKLWDKVNLDKFADLLEDRLFLPAGLNNPQAKVDAQRQQAQAMAQRQQMMEKTLPALAGAAKDASQAGLPGKLHNVGTQLNQQTQAG